MRKHCQEIVFGSVRRFDDFLNPNARREIRGAHSRVDYPALDAVWGKQNNIISSQRGAMALRQEPVPAMPEELQKILAEDK